MIVESNINAWNELSEIIGDNEIKCAMITINARVIKLPINYDTIEYNKFTAKLMCVDYCNETNGSPFVNGIVWLTDDSWLVRVYVDWTEKWQRIEIPEIPETLYRRSNDSYS